MNHKNLRIFVIEDDLIYSSKLKVWLDNISNHVNFFTNAEDAIKPIAEDQPSIILLDNLLPELNGKDVINLYKTCYPGAKIIMMSSLFSIDDIAKSIQNKADFMVDKNDLTEDKLEHLIDSCVNKKDEANGLWSKITSFTNRIANFGSKEIVIVEDDEIFAMLLKKKIEQFSSDFKITIFTEVDDFYTYAGDNTPKYIFLDYNFPYVNGQDVLVLINSVLPSSKVIVISSQDDPKVAISLKSLGIHSYIRKDEEWKENLTKVMQELIYD